MLLKITMMISFLFSINLYADDHTKDISEELKKQRSERIVKVFNGLRKDNMEILDSFYHPNLVFRDPLVEVKTLDNMKKYYMSMYDAVIEIKFIFSNEVIQNNEHVVFWELVMKNKNLNSGEQVSVIGNSHIIFDSETNKVIYHRDFFDVGALVYEHVPVVGYWVRKVKVRLQDH